MYQNADAAVSIPQPDYDLKLRNLNIKSALYPKDNKQLAYTTVHLHCLVNLLKKHLKP